MTTFTEQLEAGRHGWLPQDFSTRKGVPEHRICIASDVHVPYHDVSLLARMLDQCQRDRIEAIVWLGDLMDNPVFSSYGTPDKTATFVNELAQVRSLLETASQVVRKQYWSKGNHEHRWMRAMREYAYMEQLAGMAGLTLMIEAGQLVVSDNPTLDHAGDWMLTHPAKYATKPLTTPCELASRWQKNVAAAHCHHLGVTTDQTGGFLAVETGGLFHPGYHHYIQHSMTAHRAWASGFVFIIDGQPQLFRKERTIAVDRV